MHDKSGQATGEEHEVSHLKTAQSPDERTASRVRGGAYAALRQLELDGCQSPGEPEQITVGTGVSPRARSNPEARDDRYEQAAAIIFTDFTPR